MAITFIFQLLFHDLKIRIFSHSQIIFFFYIFLPVKLSILIKAIVISIFLPLVFLSFHSDVAALSSFSDAVVDSFVVSEITVTGNNKTKERIILRELSFTKGDKISATELDTLLKINRENVFNLHLFLEVSITAHQADERNLKIEVVVKERWYTLPNFSLELADRSINEWWKYGHQLKRINYAIALTKQNCRGLNETATIGYTFGFSNLLLLLYDIPYIDKKAVHGLSFGIQYLQNREIVYGVDSMNSLLFFRDDDFVRKRALFSIYYQYRPGIKNTHLFDLSYHYNHVRDTVLLLNPGYLSGDAGLNFLSFTYTFTRNNTDIHFYPAKGYFYSLSVRNYGLGLHKSFSAFDAGSTFAYYASLLKNIRISSGIIARISSKKDQQFLYAPNLGYEGIFVRGYEYYLIKGQGYLLGKNELKYRILNTRIHLKFIPASKFNTIPLEIYSKCYGDIAYVFDRGNYKNYNLSNRWIYGGGIGFDVVSYYDIVIRVEYSLNAKGETGLFFHLLKAI